MISTVAQMVREAEDHADQLSKDRLRAIEYNEGVMHDTPSDSGRSSMVSRVVRAQVKRVMPSLRRTMLGSDTLAEYQPQAQGDEPAAKQATDYINSVIVQECDVRRHIEDALHDAALVRNGILRWWWSEKVSAETSKHSGLAEDAFAELVGDDEVEVLEHTERQEMVLVEDEMGQPVEMPVNVHDVKIRRTTVDRRARVACVPRERFLIHPHAVTLEDSLLTGEKMRVTRSDLISMGYDRKQVEGLATTNNDDDEERDARRDHVTEGDEPHPANEALDYYDVYVRYDKDGDGIAELRHMCFAGGLGENNLLHDEECDEIQYADIKLMAQPHQWEGISLADDLMDLQRAETVILRQTLDNLYWQNNPQPTYQAGAVMNPEAVTNPEFGLPIKVREGVSVRDALGTHSVPFFAKESFGMLEYLSQEAQERTGVSEASAGLNPDALQNMTATSANMINNASIGQTELMVATAAEGLRKFFGGLLRLIIRHQDQPRTVRLRDEWIEVDPRHWNANMDATVNVGLGAGTRERDMQVMQFVMAMQEKLLEAFGPDNPFVSPQNLWEALSRSVEAAGLKSPDLYFSEPDPQKIEQLLSQGQQGPTDTEVKAQEAQAKVQMDMQKAKAEMDLAREKMMAETQLAREKMQAEMQLAREKMQMEARIGAVKASSEIGGDVRFGGAVG